MLYQSSLCKHEDLSSDSPNGHSCVHVSPHSVRVDRKTRTYLPPTSRSTETLGKGSHPTPCAGLAHVTTLGLGTRTWQEHSQRIYKHTSTEPISHRATVRLFGSFSLSWGPS